MAGNTDQKAIAAELADAQVRNRQVRRPAHQTPQIRLMMFCGSRSSVDVTEIRITTVICRAGSTERGGDEGLGCEAAAAAAAGLEWRDIQGMRTWRRSIGHSRPAELWPRCLDRVSLKRPWLDRLRLVSGESSNLLNVKRDRQTFAELIKSAFHCVVCFSFVCICFFVF